jgi:hypothetical protein
LFLSLNVDFVVVGAHALAFHGVPRFTGDLDLVVKPTPENAAKVMQALRQFGFGGIGVREEDFHKEDQCVQLGYRPVRIDLMTGITGVSIEELWASRVPGHLDGKPVFFMGLDSLKRNKTVVSRPKDQVDLADLDKLHNRKKD